jgi:hypothetical protein
MKKAGKSAVFLLVLLLGVTARVHAETYVLSFDALNVPPGERVVGFDIKLKPAYVSSMKSMPLGWHINIDNEPSWNAELTGGVIVGAAALDKAALNSLLVVTTDKEMGALVVTGEVVTTSDFAHEHHLILKPSDVHAVVIQREGNSK